MVTEPSLAGPPRVAQVEHWVLGILAVIAGAFVLTLCPPVLKAQSQPHKEMPAVSAKTETGKLDALIRQMGSPDFKERRAATEALRAGGPETLVPLRTAALHDND